MKRFLLSLILISGIAITIPKITIPHSQSASFEITDPGSDSVEVIEESWNVSESNKKEEKAISTLSYNLINFMFYKILKTDPFSQKNK